MSFLNHRVRILYLLVAALAGSHVASGQESRATLLGRVVDPSGAVVVGAKVRAINTGTNTAASSTTNEHGNYEIPYLPSGPYRVEVEAAGFKKLVQQDVELHVADRQAIDFTLELGAIAESVTVGGQSELLDTATASAGTIMLARQASELPIVGGNAFYLARLTPGVLSSAGRSAGNPMDAGAATGIIVNGVRSGSSEITMDGVPNMAQGNGASPPIQDLVQEFKIQTTTYDASIGHGAGAVTNVSLKSGTNKLHATSYGFYSRWRAVPWFTNKFIYDPTTGPITQEKKDQALEGWRHERWGATFGGPVVLPRLYNGRNKTFWVFGYEGLYIMRNLNTTYNVPPDAQRLGDFSALLKISSRYQIYDPMTTRAAATAGRFNRDPLPGNIVPTSRLDPAALKLLQYWPKANQAGTVDFQNNYFRTRNIDRDDRNLIGKIDQNFSEQHRMFFRISDNLYKQKQDVLPGLASGTNIVQPDYGAVLDDVYMFNPHTLLNVRYGVTYEDLVTSRRSQGMDLLTLGFSPNLVKEIFAKNTPEGIAFPQISVDGLQKLGDAGGNHIATVYHTVAGTLTHMRGSHSLRLGGELRVLRENGFNYGAVAPNLPFSTSWTRGPVDNSTASPGGVGQGLASMLFGLPTGGSIAINASRAEQTTYSGLYLQDDWRITPKLSVNIGLRWELEGADTERFNRSVRGFDFAATSPISDAAKAAYAKAPDAILPVAAFRTMGGYTFPAIGGQPRALWDADKNNFGPRFGFAYNVAAKTVLRGGFGIFYDAIGVDRTDVTQSGYSQANSVLPTNDNGLTWHATLQNPFPEGLQAPVGAAAGLATYLGRSITYYPEKALNPYMQRWSFSIQRELPSRILTEVAYVGNRGTKLPVSREWDFVPAQYLSKSPVRDQPTIDYMTAQVTNPFYGIAGFEGTARGTNLRIARNQLVTPIPQFTGVNATLPIGYSWFHSMQTRVEKHMTHGVSFQVGWMWSKMMEANNFINNSDPYMERVISDQDFTHRITVSGIFELPVGRGRKLLGSAHGVLNGALGGWSVQGWFEGQTGDTLGFGNGTIFNGSLQNIALPVGQRSVERWFNVDAGFERDPAKQLAQNVNTFPTRFSGIRADGINNFDLSLFKTFRIREGLRAQFRLETFNSLNHVQLGAPDTTPTSSAFGTITAEKGHGQRQVTLAIKVMF
jgi:hypothetical protein